MATCLTTKRKKGTWKFTEKATIRAQSQKPSSALQVRESVNGDKKFLVTVVYSHGAVIPDAKLFGIADGMNFKCVTSEDGVCDIPKSSSFELEWNRFRSEYKIKNPTADRFLIELTYEQLEPVIDEVWMIEGNHLYVEFEGAFDKSYSLKKVPASRARKLFQPAKSK